MPNQYSTLPTDLTSEDLRFLDETPKAVLYAIAKHLASLATEQPPDEALRSGAYLERMREEWVVLHNKGVVTQTPIRSARTSISQRKAG